MKVFFSFFLVCLLMVVFFLVLRVIQKYISNSNFFLKKKLGQFIQIKEVSFIDPKNKIVFFQCDHNNYVALISPQGSSFLPSLKNEISNDDT